MVKVRCDYPFIYFSSDKYGIYELTYSVVDNKTGVKFSLSTKITVTSAYLKGWAILSDMNGRSVLSFIKVKTVKKLYYDSYGEEAYKDSIVYEEVEKDIVPDLGTEPRRLLESTGYWDLAYQEVNSGEEVLYDELIVMQGSKWVELNGNSLMRSVYTEEEFNGDIPEDFSPVDAVMTYSSKFCLIRMGMYTIIKGLLPMIFMQVFIYQIQYGAALVSKNVWYTEI